MNRAVERFEAVLGPADLARFSRPEVAESENAATWLVAGAGAVVLAGDQRGLIGAGGSPWDAGELALARRVVDDNAPALELLHRAAGCAASSYSIDYRQGPNVELPPLIELLRAGKLLWIDGRLALAAGHTARLETDLAALDRLAESLAGESLLVAALVAGAVDRHYLDLAHLLVTEGSEDLELLARVEAVLAGRDRQVDYLRSLAAEGAMLLSLAPDKVLVGGAGSPSWLWVRLNRLASPLLTPAMLDEFSAVAELVAMPWPEVVAASEARREQPFPRSFAVTLYPNLIDSIGKLKAGQSVNRLALEAIRQKRGLLTGGAYREPAAPRIDPYSGREVLVEQRPDGTLLLEAPGALERWHAQHPGGTRLGDPHFSWVLPATR